MLRDTAPVQRLPAEIISEIFYLAIEDLRGNIGVRARLSLAQICSRWRELAIDVSCLWHHIDITPSSVPGTAWLNPLLLENVWLPRSHNIPVIVYISSLRHNHPSSRSLVAILLEVSPRWKELHVSDYNLAAFLTQRAVNSPLPAPALRVLHLRDSDFACLGEPHLRVFGAAPALAEMRLDAWVRMGHALRFLQNQAFLTTFAVAIDLDFVGDKTPSPVYHNALRSLLVRCATERRTAFPTLAHVALPSLTQFILVSHRANVIWDHEKFASFLQRSHCCLRKLTLQHVAVELESLLDTLGAVPSLKYLFLLDVWSAPVDSFFTRLTYTDDEQFDDGIQTPCLLPALEQLCVGSDYSVGSSKPARHLVLLCSRISVTASVTISPQSGAIDSISCVLQDLHPSFPKFPVLKIQVQKI